jgi:O-antigen/teichoic acid export membrane protein
LSSFDYLSAIAQQPDDVKSQELVQVRKSRSTGPWAAWRIAVASLYPTPDTERRRATLVNWPHIINIGLLITGLGVGQGAIFAVQTWLVAKGQFELLAWFGTHYSFAILGIILTDGGSSTIVAREMARLSSGHGTTDEFWRIFCETVVFRVLTAALIGISAAIYAVTVASDGFSRFYLLCALPSLLFWAVNPIGLLDGLKLSGISGITGSLAYAASAIGLALTPNASPEMAGTILGGAFSGGYFLTVLAQWTALRRYGWEPRIEKVTSAGLVLAFKNGSAMLFQLLPGQIVSRVQLLLSAMYLGPETTAVFTYVKQIVNALSMIVAVVLRVDFPGLVQKVSRTKTLSFRGLLEAQKTTLYCAIAFTAGAIIVSSLSFMVPQNRFSAAAKTLLTFSPTILTTSFSLMMMQVMIALGAYAPVARIAAISAALGIAISCLLVRSVDLYAFLAAELLSHLLVFVLMYNGILRLSRLPESSPEGVNM